MAIDEDDATDYRALLEELYPSATFSVELPYTGNGNLYQVRMTVYDEIFYGRAGTEEDAVTKCCKKATRCVLQRDMNSNHILEKVYPLFIFHSTLNVGHFTDGTKMTCRPEVSFFPLIKVNP